MTRRPATTSLAADRPDPAQQAVLADFVEQMGILGEDGRMPRIAGRLFGLFLVETRPLSLRDLADRLRVSKASVSTNTRLLAAAGMIERVSMPGDRQDYYRFASVPLELMLQEMLRHTTRVAKLLAATGDKLSDSNAEVRARLSTLAAFHEAAGESLKAVIRKFGDKSIL
ncbi:MAG: MarR family transcriptional regulator [Bauldia sp.]|nr:MarR family transcriptional regulator [Bauldia sp.]